MNAQGQSGVAGVKAGDLKSAAKRAWKIPYLRWWITALLFLSTVINYIDRQTLSILARTIQDELRISDLQYSYVVQAFLAAYTVTFLFAGRLTDWLGTRVSMALFMAWWSLANMCTALSRSALSLGVFRFLLGVGQPGNYTAAPKAVSEWFPDKERGLVVGIYTAGATLGATIAPPLIALFGTRWGWRSAFFITGSLGLLWVVPWWWLYRRPERHPRITEQEFQVVAPHVQERKTAAVSASELERWRSLLGRRDTWLLVLGRVLTDPVWYFYLFWFPKYLIDARHLTLLQVGQFAWLVYLAADIGSVLGGWVSGLLIRRGMRPVAARKRVLLFAACLLPLSPLVAFVPSTHAAVAVAAVVVLAHLTWQVALSVIIVDLYPQEMVATMFGIVGAGSGLGGVLSTNVVGHIVSRYSYAPLFVAMGLLHPLALLLVRHVREHPPARRFV